MKRLLAIISIFFLTVFIVFETKYVLATSTAKNSTTTSTCTHIVYSTSSPSAYHYRYCSICGRCNFREIHSISRIENNGDYSTHATYCSCGRYIGESSHSFSYSRYNLSYHKVACSCGYSGYRTHNPTAVKINIGEVINSKRYSTLEDLDTAHKLVCTNCGTIVGTGEHTWGRGDTLAHRCISCLYIHSKQYDETKGLHYFDIDKIRTVGNVAPCVVCKKYLQLTYDETSILDELPKKEEYTMVGNPNPMKEKEITSDQKILSNYMPINENGELIPMDENYLRVRSYINGNYYRHYSKLIGEKLSDITGRIEYIQNPEITNYITNKLSELRGFRWIQ